LKIFDILATSTKKTDLILLLWGSKETLDDRQFRFENGCNWAHLSNELPTPPHHTTQNLMIIDSAS